MGNLDWGNSKSFKRWSDWKTNFKDHLIKDLETKKRGRSHEVYERFYFRGQGDPDWQLQPTFDRRNRLRDGKRDKFAQELVRDFIHQVKRFEPFEFNDDDVNAIALAQHHGLPTRLLDWSASPYVAAFFAFEDRLMRERFDGDVAIWALDTRERELKPLPKGEDNTAVPRKEYLINENCEFHRLSDHTNLRMGNQQGAFTKLATDYDLLHFLRQHKKTALLKRFRIPANQAVDALDDLILMGIHRASLFPDREGAAAHVDMRSRLAALRDRFVDSQGRLQVERLRGPTS